MILKSPKDQKLDVKKLDPFGKIGHNLGVKAPVPSVTAQPDAREGMVVAHVVKT